MILSMDPHPRILQKPPRLLKLDVTQDAQASEFLRRLLKADICMRGPLFSMDSLDILSLERPAFISWPKTAPRPAIAYISDDLAILHFSDQSILLGAIEAPSLIRPLPFVLNASRVVRMPGHPAPLAWRTIEQDGSEYLISSLGPLRSAAGGRNICLEVDGGHIWFRAALVTEARAWIDSYHGVRKEHPEDWPAALCQVKKTLKQADEIALQCYLGDICTYLGQAFSITGRLGISVSFLAPRQDQRDSPVEISLLPNGGADTGPDADAIKRRARCIIESSNSPWDLQTIKAIVTPAAGRIHYKQPQSFSLLGLNEINISRHRSLEIFRRLHPLEEGDLTQSR